MSAITAFCLGFLAAAIILAVNYEFHIAEMERENKLLKRTLQDYFRIEDSGQTAFDELLRETASSLRGR